MTGNWKEAEDRVVKLPEDKPSLFSTYVHHLYTGELAVNLDDVNKGEVGTRVMCQYEDLCALYVLAEKLQDIQTKNAIIQTILDIRHTIQSNNRYLIPNGEAIRIIYDGTTAGSLARKLLVDFWAYRGKGLWLRDYELPADFLRDLVIKLMDTRPVIAGMTKDTSSTYMEDVAEEKA